MNARNDWEKLTGNAHNFEPLQTTTTIKLMKISRLRFGICGDLPPFSTRGNCKNVSSSHIRIP